MSKAAKQGEFIEQLRKKPTQETKSAFTWKEPVSMPMKEARVKGVPGKSAPKHPKPPLGQDLPTDYEGRVDKRAIEKDLNQLKRRQQREMRAKLKRGTST